MDIRFIDPRGKWHHVTFDLMMVDDDFLNNGTMFDGSSIAGWKANNESDMLLIPDATTAFVAEVADASDFRHHRTTGAGYHTRRGEVGDWRNHFSAEDEELFRELAGDVFEAVRY